MKHEDTVSDELLSAFIDNQLDDDERVVVLKAIQHDEVLADDLCDFHQVKEFMDLTYRNPPKPDTILTLDGAYGWSPAWMGLAAGLLLKSEILLAVGRDQEAIEIKQEAEFLPEGNWTERIPVR